MATSPSHPTRTRRSKSRPSTPPSSWTRLTSCLPTARSQPLTLLSLKTTTITQPCLLRPRQCAPRRLRTTSAPPHRRWQPSQRARELRLPHLASTPTVAQLAADKNSRAWPTAATGHRSSLRLLVVAYSTSSLQRRMHPELAFARAAQRLRLPASGARPSIAPPRTDASPGLPSRTCLLHQPGGMQSLLHLQLC